MNRLRIPLVLGRILCFFWIVTTWYGGSRLIRLQGIHPQLSQVNSTVTTVTSGTVEAQSDAILSFGTIGRINKIFVKVGEVVKKGTLIAELENSDLKAIYS